MDDLRTLLEALPKELDLGTLFSIDGDVATIAFRSERAQKIRMLVRHDHYVFTSRILGSRRVKNMTWSELARRVWPRNRRTPLVTFMLDKQGRLVGRVEHPQATLDQAELRAILLHLARECDRLEFLLTGRDEH